MTSEQAWAAGFVDGEGCFYFLTKDHSLAFAMTQVDPRPLQRFVEAVGFMRVRGPYARKDGGYGIKPYHSVSCQGANAWKLMALLWPMLSGPKREQIRRSVDKVNTKR